MGSVLISNLKRTVVRAALHFDVWESSELKHLSEAPRMAEVRKVNKLNAREYY